MKSKRAILHIDESLCNGCGQCVLDCAEGAIQIIDGKAKIVSDSFCDGLGACLGGCPTGALTITEREAVPFDEAAAMEHVAKQHDAQTEESVCGCKGHEHGAKTQQSPCAGGHAQAAFGGGAAHGAPAGVARQTFAAPAPRRGGCPGAQAQGAPWPVKLRLIPPDAPFLKGADLVIAADCAASVAARFYEEYAKGSVVLIGCPKFEDTGAMTEKLTAIFTTAKPRSCTVLRMEVPCCAGIVEAARDAYEASGRGFFWREIILSRRGEAVVR